MNIYMYVYICIYMIYIMSIDILQLLNWLDDAKRFARSTALENCNGTSCRNLMNLCNRGGATVLQNCPRGWGKISETASWKRGPTTCNKGTEQINKHIGNKSHIYPHIGYICRCVIIRLYLLIRKFGYTWISQLFLQPKKPKNRQAMNTLLLQGAQVDWR